MCSSVLAMQSSLFFLKLLIKNSKYRAASFFELLKFLLLKPGRFTKVYKNHHKI